MHKSRLISILVDHESWILPYAQDLVSKINAQGQDQARLCRSHKSLEEGDLCFFLGCIHIAHPEILAKHDLNLVIHESPLPQGRGFAPLTWQILEGKKEIVFSLLEAAQEADAGDIYLQKTVTFNGFELCDEIRHIQGCTTIEMVQEFLAFKTIPKPKPQTGKASFYKRRTPQDSQLDIHKTIKEQFSLLRVVDNQRYPAFFEIDGHKYKIKITKMD